MTRNEIIACLIGIQAGAATFAIIQILIRAFN